MDRSRWIIIRRIAKVLVFGYGCLGAYPVLCDWIHIIFDIRILPDISFLPGAVVLYAILFGLPAAGLLAFFQTGIRAKIAGVLFFIVLILGLVLFDRALV